MSSRSSSDVWFERWDAIVKPAGISEHDFEGTRQRNNDLWFIMRLSQSHQQLIFVNWCYAFKFAALSLNFTMNRRYIFCCILRLFINYFSEIFNSIKSRWTYLNATFFVVGVLSVWNSIKFAAKKFFWYGIQVIFYCWTLTLENSNIRSSIFSDKIIHLTNCGH